MAGEPHARPAARAGGYVVWKTDVIEEREQTEEQGNGVEVALEDPA